MIGAVVSLLILVQLAKEPESMAPKPINKVQVPMKIPSTLAGTKRPTIAIPIGESNISPRAINI